MPRKLNIGCGSRFGRDWTNIDYAFRPPHIIGHDLRATLPYADNSFDLVYSSHVLEHFTAEEGKALLREQFRVLKPGGAVRCVVPDLELLAQVYLRELSEARRDMSKAPANYEWSVLAILDQSWRNIAGGGMVDFLKHHGIDDLRFVFEREGGEIRNLHAAIHSQSDLKRKSRISGVRDVARRLRNAFLGFSNRVFDGQNFLSTKDRDALRIGRFRVSGEVHYWMYDEWSLGVALAEAGFENIVRRSAVESYLPGWSSENLDTEPDGSVYKPSSLFMEAQKLK